MNVIVLFGGKSTEYEISCKSAFNVLSNINQNYNVQKIGITKEGKWYYTDASNEEIRDGLWISSNTNSPVDINFTEKCFKKDGQNIKCDIVFPVLHGKNGEDGTIQGLLEMLDVPYVGCSVMSSAVCMDKIMANIIFEREGINHVKWISAEKSEYVDSPDKIIQRFSGLKFPVFIKPSNAGSSVGVTKCNTAEDIDKALKLAFLVDARVIAEEGISSPMEIEVAVMGNEKPIAAIAGRVMSATEVYDYSAKYENDASYNQLPAQISDELSEEIRKTAIKAYESCKCSGLSRVDFFVDSDENVYLNEINTMPGFTSISMFPQAFAKSGYDYTELIDKLIEYGFNYKKYKGEN